MNTCENCGAILYDKNARFCDFNCLIEFYSKYEDYDERKGLKNGEKQAKKPDNS